MMKYYFSFLLLTLMLQSCSINSDLYNYLPENVKTKFENDGYIQINDSLKIKSLTKDQAKTTIRPTNNKRKFIFVYDAACDTEDLSVFNSLSYLAKERTIDFDVVLLSYHPNGFIDVPPSMHTRNIYVIDRTFGSKKWNRELSFLTEVFPELGIRKKGLSSAMVFVLDTNGNVVLHNHYHDAFTINRADVYKALKITL